MTYAADHNHVNECLNLQNYHFAKGDILDFGKLLETLMEFEPDTIFHLAAESHVDNSIKSPNAFIETNVNGTLHLLEAFRIYLSHAAKSFKEKKCKLIHVSTDEVYGALPHPDDSCFEQVGLPARFTEKSPYNPSSPYSASKAASDHLVKSWQITYDLPAIITNCSNNFGARQHEEKLIPTVVKNLKNGNPIPLYGNGRQIRDWLSVDDHVRALEIIAANGQVGEKYNIGSNNEIMNIELVTEIICIFNEIKGDSNFEEKNVAHYVNFVNDRKGHDKRYAIDSSKIIKTLGWTPTNDFKKKLTKTISWYLEKNSNIGEES